MTGCLYKIVTGSESQFYVITRFEASMATAKHWTVEPDAKATIKVSFIHLFLEI